jgi:hypothetical protein
MRMQPLRRVTLLIAGSLVALISGGPSTSHPCSFAHASRADCSIFSSSNRFDITISQDPLLFGECSIDSSAPVLRLERLDSASLFVPIEIPLVEVERPSGIAATGYAAFRPVTPIPEGTYRRYENSRTLTVAAGATPRMPPVGDSPGAYITA